MLTVMKFGGSILETEQQLLQLAAVVKKRVAKEEIAIVSSALKGVTDSLINAAKNSLKGSASVEQDVAAIKEKHLQLLACVKDSRAGKQAGKQLLQLFAELERVLYGIAYLKELSPRSLDLVQTMGERLSVLLLEAYLQDSGVDAVALDGIKEGIATNSDFGKAMPEMRETKKRFAKKAGKMLQKNVVVLPGFFGADREGNIVSFGRGGSDFSAAIVAAVLNANALELWKDVDGFLSADPKIVQEAMLLQHLNYDEAEELGYFGAKIMYPKTVVPLREKGIPIIMKNVLQPEKTGTVVSKRKQVHEKIIKSIAIRRDVACITLRSPAFIGQAGVLQKIFTTIAEAGVSVDLVATSERGVSFTIDEKDLEAAKKAIPSINLPLDEVNFDRDVAMVGVVGEGIKSTPGIAAKIFGCIGRQGINVEMISLGSSEINLSFLVKEKDLERAVKALHEELQKE